MATERETIDIKKSMAYDLQNLFVDEQEKGRESLSVKEINAMIRAYVKGLESASSKQ